MKKITLTLLALLVAGIAFSQTKTVSILGDSYSTYEDFVTPATNELWYYAKNGEQKTDVKNVRQTWWHQVIKENGWRLAVNNSYSGATISYTGYDGNDYSPRSSVSPISSSSLVLPTTVGLARRLVTISTRASRRPTSMPSVRHWLTCYSG